MKLTLMIEGSAATIAHVLANLPSDATVSSPTAPSVPPAAPAVGLVPGPGTALPTPPSAPAPVEADDDDGPANANAPDVDSNGLPWDARIHSSTKGINNDGSWKKKRRASDELVATVTAELRARAPQQPAPTIPQPVALSPAIPMQPTAPMPVAAPAPQPVPQMQPAPIPQPTALPTATQLQEQVNAVTASAPPPVVPQPHTPGSLDMAGFMARLAPLFELTDAAGAPLVHAEYLAGITNEVSNAFMQAGQITQPLNTLADMGDNRAMIDYTIACMTRDGRWM
jgi:hypothetical protein